MILRLFIGLVILSLASVQTQSKAQVSKTSDMIAQTQVQSIDTNPFMDDWSQNKYNIPPFDKIKDIHYKNAIDWAIEVHNKEIIAILKNREEVSFENSVLAIDNAGQDLERVLLVFYNVYGAESTPYLRSIMPEIAQKISLHYDNIYMNQYLFARVSRVKAKMDDGRLQLGEVEQRLVNETYKRFVRAGAELTFEDMQKLKNLNQKLSELENKFGQNVLEATSSDCVLVGSREDLKGLDENYIEQASAKAKDRALEGVFVLGLDNPSLMPALNYIEDEKLREVLLSKYLNRCTEASAAQAKNETSNEKIVQEIINLRLQKAQILGYKNYADYELEDRMAGKTSAVYNLLDQVWTKALDAAKKDLKTLQKLKKTKGFLASDWRFYENILRKEKYSLDEGELKQYFAIDKVREGIFYLCNTLYGISFEKLEDVPAPTPNTDAYLCKDKDNSVLGVLYLDMEARPGSKSGGAWNTSYVVQKTNDDGSRFTPVTSIVCNFPPKTASSPVCLLSLDETETFFHEFGHALHALFANVKYRGLAEVPRDFVELPSQIMEHWATAPQMLKIYAKHYKTGESIPDHLIEKIKAASRCGQAFATVEYVAAAYLDMDYHSIESPVENLNVQDFENENLNNKRGLISQIPPRYRSTYFSHTMEGGYTAGYYSYMWSEVLDCDAYEAFEESGDIFNKEVADSFRKNILENGGMYNAMDMYRNFRGRDARTEALLRNRGISKK